MLRFLLPFAFTLFTFHGLVAQDLITVHGKVINSIDQRSYYDLMIVNKRTRSGNFGNSDGTFTVQALRTDTLLIGSIGHRTKLLCFTDSVVAHGAHDSREYGHG